MRRRGIDWDKQPLGKVPDRALARRLGVAKSVVFKARERRGIEPSSRRRERERPGEYVRTFLLRHIGAYVPKTPGELHSLVMNDYGAISRRQINRHIRALERSGYVHISVGKRGEMQVRRVG